MFTFDRMLLHILRLNFKFLTKVSDGGETTSNGRHKNAHKICMFDARAVYASRQQAGTASHTIRLKCEFCVPTVPTVGHGDDTRANNDARSQRNYEQQSRLVESGITRVRANNEN